MSKIKPDYNHNNASHWFIWHVLSHEVTKEDFEAIQMSLIKREDDHELVDKATVYFREFDKDMMQPRPIPDWQKEKAHAYVDWACAIDIWMILSKYADFYSKKK